MLFPEFVASVAGRVIASIESKAIADTTLSRIVGNCDPEERSLCWQNEGRNMAAAWASTDGWSNGPRVGFIRIGI
jgi:hypothetical protein